ncbi:phytanoyl-CoA dioxygenase family [Hyaloraphidium curvatum]|nr:phytanoyl-CoA dioxygenase family [Hyaloraphidium curvatum]
MSKKWDDRFDSADIHKSMNMRRPLVGGGAHSAPGSGSGEYSFAEHIRKLEADAALKEPLKSRLTSLFRDGYVIVEDMLSEAELRGLEAGLAPLLDGHSLGRNAFEGLTTQRVYGLLGKSRAFDGLAANPIMMELLDRVLQPNYLLTAYQAIKILPGEEQQNLHTDDSFIRVPRPRQPFSVAVIYAIDDFTATNGATVVVPGSHVWGQDRIPDATKDRIIPVVMKRGSGVIFLSTLWHGGGKNTSDKPRLAITAQYLEPYLRPQENQFLLVPFAEVLMMPNKLKSLLGYSIHPPFIGFANGEHPLKRIDASTGGLHPLGRTEPKL